MESLSLNAVHQEMQALINECLSECITSERSGHVSSYFSRRGQSQRAIKQDLLPLLVFTAISNQPYIRALPLAACWALHLAAAHLIDAVQDRGDIAGVHASVLALGVANIVLAQLEVDGDAVRDILDAVGRVVVLGVQAQGDELRHGRIWTRDDYFRSIAGKAASIIATGAWMGGRLVTEDGTTLTALKEFGFALGMTIQISDDCLDLEEDLENGTYTLPVIEGLTLTTHTDYPQLEQLLQRSPLLVEERQAIVRILENMGVFVACQRLIRAYQVQSAAAFLLFPKLEPYFCDYVAATTT